MSLYVSLRLVRVVLVVQHYSKQPVRQLRGSSDQGLGHNQEPVLITIVNPLRRRTLGTVKRLGRKYVTSASGGESRN